MQRPIFLITLLLIYSNIYPILTTCNSFKKVKMTVHPDEGKSYRVEITGCIEKTAFKSAVTQIFIKGEDIPKLGRDSVRNMENLSILSFDNCKIYTIESKSFRNAPNLQIIKVVNGNLTVVPKDVFQALPKLEMLKLDHNKITFVEEEAFAGIPTLRRLYCDNNEIKEWRNSWFTNSTNLQILNFSYNQIKILPLCAFCDLPKLKEVSLDYNELEIIESEAFRNIEQLQYLGLRYNRLKTLHPRIFPNAVSINMMKIDANYLNFIPRRIMVTLDVAQMSIYGNPWNCPCLDQILLWLHQINATIVRSEACSSGDVPVCSISNVYSTICTESVDSDVTKTYIEALKRIEPPLERHCARLN